MKRTQSAIVLALAAILGTGCEHARDVTVSQPPRPTIRLPAPEPGFRLTAAERGSIRVGFDVDALERLLSMVEAPVRPMILESFQPAKPGEPVSLLLQLGDPALQPLLDEVWAPMWERRPDGAWRHDPDPRWPGRELARQRIEKRRNDE
jgi:hypothetical protein